MSSTKQPKVINYNSVANQCEMSGIWGYKYNAVCLNIIKALYVATNLFF